MTDNRIEKIRAEIERLKHQSVIDSDRQAERGLQSASMASFGKVKACEELLSFIDSMQKEPKECMYSKDNYTDEDRKVLCEGCEEECEFNKKEEPVSKEQVKESLISKHEDKTCKENGDSLTQEPVSEELEEAGKEWLKPQLDKSYANYGEAKMMELTHFDGYAMLDAIEFGANWKEQQMMKKAFSAEIGKQRPDYKCVLNGNFFKYDTGDKVKVLIIKED